jgi:hypothetical protein
LSSIAKRPKLVGLGVLAQDGGEEEAVDDVGVGGDVGVAVLDREAGLGGVEEGVEVGAGQVGGGQHVGEEL